MMRMIESNVFTRVARAHRYLFSGGIMESSRLSSNCSNVRVLQIHEMAQRQGATRCRQTGGRTVRWAQDPSGTRSVNSVSVPTGWAAPRAHVRCSVLSGLTVESSDETSFEEGQRVRVAAQVMFMHVPGNKKGYEVQGLVGEVIRVYDQPNLSPTRGVKVAFDEPKKWIGHFEPSELELKS